MFGTKEQLFNESKASARATYKRRVFVSQLRQNNLRKSIFKCNSYGLRCIRRNGKWLLGRQIFVIVAIIIVLALNAVKINYSCFCSDGYLLSFLLRLLFSSKFENFKLVSTVVLYEELVDSGFTQN